MLIALLAALVPSALAVDGYQSAKWGMAEADVRAVVTPGECSGTYKVEAYFCAPAELLGRKGEAVYIFAGGKLIRVNLNFSGADAKLFDELKPLLAEKYGTPVVEAKPPVSGMYTIKASWVSEGVTMTFMKFGSTSLSVSYDGEAAAAGAEAKSAL